MIDYAFRPVPFLHGLLTSSCYFGCPLDDDDYDDDYDDDDDDPF